MSAPDKGKVAAGVEELIELLRTEGIAKGEQDAKVRLAEAEHRASEILRQAQAQATNILTAARLEAEGLQTAGREALQMAFRDTVIRLRDELTKRFREEVGRLVGRELDKADCIRQLLMQLADRCREQSGLCREESLHVVLPRTLVGLEELRVNPEELKEGTLTHLVSSIAGDLLSKGVTFDTERHKGRGIRLRLREGTMEVDITDEACAEVLLEHLQPRFRALLEGVVK